MMLTYLASFCKFNTVANHGRLVKAQPFELHIEFRSPLMSLTHARVHLAHSFMSFMVGDAPEEYTIQVAPI